MQLERDALGLFSAALERDARDRDSWLQTACAGDAALLARVRDLLAADAAQDQAAIGDSPAGDGSTPLLPPAQIGPYGLEELIGAGGMGSVYRARRNDGLFEQRVAVKFIRPLRGLTQIEALIDAERRLLARMEHPGIARILDGGTTATGLHYLVMEFISGIALDEFVAIHRLDVNARISLLREVCAAVAHAHQNLVLHCDIKPANVLVASDGRPKLIDFGVARIQDVVDATRPEGFTRAYTSPQRLAGAPATVSDDIYSLGIVLAEIVAQVREHPRGELGAIVRKATALEREARYASVAAFDDDLRNFLERRPLAAVGRHWRYRARKLVQRHPWRVATASLALAALVTALAVISGLYTRAEAERHKSEVRFNEVRSLAKFMIFDLGDRLEGLPRSLAARRDAVNAGQQYLNRLSADISASAELQLDTMAGLLRLASLQGRPGASSLGAVDDARRNLALAAAIGQRLTQQGRGSARTELLQARIELERARFNTDLESDLPAAERAMQRSRVALERALGDAALAEDARAVGFEWRLQMANLRQWQGQYAESMRFARAALAQVATLSAAARATRDNRLLEARAYDLLAEGTFYSGDEAGAVAPYESQLAILNAALGAYPGDTRVLRAMARARWALGTTQTGLNQFRPALRQLEQADSELQLLRQFDPDDRELDRLRTINDLGRAQALAGLARLAEAVPIVERGIEIRRRAWAAAPADLGRARDYAVGLAALGDILLQARQSARACGYFAQAQQVYAELRQRARLAELDNDYGLRLVREQLARYCGRR